MTYGEIILKHAFELHVSNSFMNYKLSPVSCFHTFSYFLIGFSVIYYIKVDIQYQIACLAHLVWSKTQIVQMLSQKLNLMGEELLLMEQTHEAEIIPF